MRGEITVCYFYRILSKFLSIHFADEDDDESSESEESKNGKEESSEEEEAEEKENKEKKVDNETAGTTEEKVNKGKKVVSEIAATTEAKPEKKGKKMREKIAKGKTLMKQYEVVKDPNDEYAYDSSDEEDIRNTVGNIPLNWYDDYNHLGYDWVRKSKDKTVLD